MKVEILRRDCPSRSPHFNPLRPCGRRHLTCISANNVMCISIHSARVGGDRFAGINLLRVIKFQSTPPVWAETPRLEPLPAIRIISIHSARVGGDYDLSVSHDTCIRFQSTPPVWAETCSVGWPGLLRRFQSTPPVWAETSYNDIFPVVVLISIHSARVGGDLLQVLHAPAAHRISIHSARVGGDFPSLRT